MEPVIKCHNNWLRIDADMCGCRLRLATFVFVRNYKKLTYLLQNHGLQERLNICYFTLYGILADLRM